MAEKPKTISRKDSSITLSFENVFPIMQFHIRCTLFLEVLNNLKEWQQIYHGKKIVHCVEGLPPCTPFNFRVKCVHSEGESDWVEFKSATATEQYYAKHLSRAIEFKKIPLIRKIIACRPTLLEVENKENLTPLIQSVETGDLNLVNFLVISGANVNQKTLVTNKTALLMALVKGHLEIVEYLLSKKADVASRDVNGLNGLHYAVDSNISKSVRFAIERGFRINEKDNQGWTPLLRAVVMEASDKIIKMLIESGSDLTVKDNNGHDFENHVGFANRKYLLNYLEERSKQK